MAVLRLKFSVVLFVGSILLSACKGVLPLATLSPVQVSPLSTLQPTRLPDVEGTFSSPIGQPTESDPEQWMKEHSINLQDSGKTFTYTTTSRFMVFLDDLDYPLKDLNCVPQSVIGYISNGSLRGPDHYPIMFEAGPEGTCLLQDRDFQVRIVIDNP
jgi:hypothetical protein